MKTLTYVVLLFGLLLPFALAQGRFGTSEFDVSEFRGLETLQSNCDIPAASSFWCDHLSDTLTHIPVKGVDFFFDDAGEFLAVFAKLQKGRRLSTFAVDGRQNLIPIEAGVPGGAVLLNGEYLAPKEIEGRWQALGDDELIGHFTFLVGKVRVEKEIRIDNASHTFEMVLKASLAEAVVDAAEGNSGAREPLTIQYAFPGIARQASPTVKIGQGTTFSLNPLSQPVADPGYVSLQNNNNNTAYAIIMRPQGREDGLAAQFLPPNIITMQKSLDPTTGSDVTIDLAVYTGPNELVRYYQEGYDTLPGLFRPNILGRLSIAIIWILQFIHRYVGGWGLSIIVLTLLFRAFIWPLISTQTRSMYGMQKLQPEIQKLQKKYKDDREKLTQETMKLYREAGVNPAGGCLPVLLQMPLFIILWRVFVNFEFNEGFLWLPDLGRPDPIYIMPILYVAVMVGQSFFSARGNPQSLRQQLLINLVFVFIILSFPAGVILYFVVSMSIQMLQYWLISRNQSAPAAAK